MKEGSSWRRSSWQALARGTRTRSRTTYPELGMVSDEGHPRRAEWLAYKKRDAERRGGGRKVK